MTKALVASVLTVIGVLLTVLSLHYPMALSDKNKFVENFTNSYLLSIFGIIIPIVTASAVQIHLYLNKVEADFLSPHAFDDVRKSLWLDIIGLISVFMIVIMLLIIKADCSTNYLIQSFINDTCILALVFYFLVLFEMIDISFSIPSSIDDPASSRPTAQSSTVPANTTAPATTSIQETRTVPLVQPDRTVNPLPAAPPKHMTPPTSEGYLDNETK